VHYAPEKSAIIWKIKQFGGGKEFLMRAELGLPSVKGDDERGGGMTGGFGGSMGGAGGVGKAKRPINVKFEIPYFTTSGIQVRYLKITEPKVRHRQWIPSTYLLNSLLIIAHSCNTPLSPGCDTSHSRATLPCVCQKFNEKNV
jgi:AP-1 complex subunit mu